LNRRISPTNARGCSEREWLDEFADEIEDMRKLDFAKREERIQNQRADAMRDVLDQLGVVELRPSAGAKWSIISNDKHNEGVEHPLGRST
jgi:hypothetical protein